MHVFNIVNRSFSAEKTNYKRKSLKGELKLATVSSRIRCKLTGYSTKLDCLRGMRPVLYSLSHD